MVACKHCSTPNSLDSAFCRRCGTSLPDAEIVVARKANEELVAEGVKLFQDGKTEEALAIAESASAADPVSVTALALKGMAHERNGHVAEALECYERIVELHPDSTLDKIKLNQLRNSLASHAAPAEPPNRKLAIIGAVGACALVIGVGGLISMLQPKTQIVASNPQKEEPAPLVERFSDPNPNQTQAQPQNANPGPANAQTNPNQAAQGNQAPPTNPQNQEPVRQNAGPTLPPVDRSSPLPNPSGNRDFRPLDPGAEPLTVDARALGNPPVANPPVSNPPRGQDPDPGTTRATEVPKPAPAAEEPRPIMEMKIRTGQPGPRTGGGSTDGNGLAAIVRTANAQFEVGNYTQAAANYERALRSGGDGGLLNQRLGQAYERQGKRADALVAYDRAAQSLEAAIASGRGDSDRLRNALESVKQARRALGGG